MCVILPELRFLTGLHLVVPVVDSVVPQDLYILLLDYVLILETRHFDMFVPLLWYNECTVEFC